MQVRVLGSASIVDRDGRNTPRPERKARELLTVLVLRAPAAVTLDELADLLWDAPPESTAKTIRAHLSRLRTAIQQAGISGGIDRAGSTAYRLSLPPQTTDVDVVAELRQRARQLLRDGRADSAASILTEARRLWLGDPELPDTVAASALTRGWQREHRQLILEHLTCVVAGADPSRALGELERHTAIDPTDEPMWVLHVQALHRSGHHTEAVRALASAREALAELGLEPGAELRRVETDVFSGPTAPPNDAVTSAPSPPRWRVDELRIEYAVTNGRHVAFAELSTGPRDLVVLNPAMITIDGILDNHYPRDALARLGEHARVICLDRRGIGLSDPLDPQRNPLDEWTDDVIQVLDTRDIRAAHLFANFDTGLVALEVAARHPERVASLVLTHGFATYQRRDDYPHGLDPSTTQQLIHDSVSPDTSRRPVDTVAHVAPSAADDDEFRRWWRLIGQRGAGPATALTIRTIATRADLRNRLEHVTSPTLVVHRRSCLNVDVGHARYLVANLPNAELAIIPGTDSLWFTDTPDLLDRTIDFLHAHSA